MQNRTLEDRKKFINTLFSTGKKPRVSSLFGGDWRGYKGTEDIEDWKTVFVDTLDPTEYEGALALGFTWEQWKHFKALAPKFAAKVAEWVDEIEVRARSKGIKQMISRAGTDNSSAAARYLADGAWTGKHGNSTEKKQQDKKLTKKINAEARDEIRRVEEAISPPETQH
jgi:hypothetical protein